MNIPYIPKAIILIFTTEVHLGPAWGDGAQPAIAAVMLDAGVHDLAAAEAEPACCPGGEGRADVSGNADRAAASARHFDLGTRAIAPQPRGD
jgi:hypothetical protein